LTQKPRAGSGKREEWHASFDAGSQFDKLVTGDATVSYEKRKVFVETVECVLG